MRILRAILSAAGAITAASTVDANIVRKDEAPLRKPFDPKDTRPPVIKIEEGPLPMQAGDPPKEDPRARLLKNFDIEINLGLQSLLDKAAKGDIKLDKAAIEQVKELQGSGKRFLDLVKGKRNRKEEGELLDKMEKIVNGLVMRNLPGHRLFLSISGTVDELKTYHALEKKN